MPWGSRDVSRRLGGQPSSREAQPTSGLGNPCPEGQGERYWGGGQGDATPGLEGQPWRCTSSLHGAGATLLLFCVTKDSKPLHPSHHTCALVEPVAPAMAA